MKNISIFLTGILIATAVIWVNIDFFYNISKYNDFKKSRINDLTAVTLEEFSKVSHTKTAKSKVRYYNKKCRDIFKTNCVNLNISEDQYNILGNTKIRDIILNHCEIPSLREYFKIACKHGYLVKDTSVKLSVFNNEGVLTKELFYYIN
jgi:hypothetical protein